MTYHSSKGKGKLVPVLH